MSGGNTSNNRNTGLYTCGCGCIVGDCYCISCHCQYSEKSLQTISKSQTSNFEITKKRKTQTKGEEYYGKR